MTSSSLLRVSAVAVALSAAFVAAPAKAGPYTDELSKCLVSNSSDADRNVLMTWMFAAIALNPEVATMSRITPEQRKKINQDMAQLFERLATESCRAPMHDAVKYEGTSAIEASFSVLGQVAGRSLFSSPEVAKGMEEMNSMIDESKLQAVFADPAAAAASTPAPAPTGSK